MVVYLDIRTEPIHENNVLSRYRGRRSSRVENFGQLDLMKPHPGESSRGPSVSRFRSTGVRRYCKLVPPRWGSCQPSLTTMRKKKGLSVVRLRSPRHTGRTHPARCPSPHNRTSGRSFRSLRRHTRQICANGFLGAPEAKNFDESFMLPGFGAETVQGDALPFGLRAGRSVGLMVAMENCTFSFGSVPTIELPPFSLQSVFVFRADAQPVVHDYEKSRKPDPVMRQRRSQGPWPSEFAS